MKKTYIIPSTEWHTVGACTLVCASIDPNGKVGLNTSDEAAVNADELDARARGDEPMPEAAEETWGELW